MSGREEHVVAMIPARGGSKSIPRKNLVSLGGKPLLVWSIETARESLSVERVIVSTDDDEIARVADRHGAEIHARPERLATDEALVIDAIRHLLEELQNEGSPPDIMVLLEPTCPFRTADDVESCVEKVRDGHDSVATFTDAEVNPHRTWRLTDEGPRPFIDGTVPWLPRQQLPDAYQLNGGVYAFRPEALQQSTGGLLFGQAGAVIVPSERSVDIDDFDDLLLAECILRTRRHGDPREQ